MSATEAQNESRFASISAFVWPGGPFQTVRKWLLWGIGLTLLAGFTVGVFEEVGVLGSGAIRALLLWDSFVTPWLIFGFAGFWILDTILVYLKE